ncbi:MAG: dihydrolipoyl dehydrogenase [Burkholderiales bacterium]
MKKLKVEVAVIGAGSAGLAAYRAVRAKGKTAVIVEGGAYGSTCARVGCMPSKLLIAAAEAAHGIERFNEFGLRLDAPLRVDGKAVMARVKRERDRFVGFVLKSVETIPASDKVRGFAKFLDDHHLKVGDDTEIAFTTAIIATGSSPFVPAILAPAGDRVIVNDDVFEWDDLPKSVAVLGPGVIGLELGQALSRLGVSVRMFGRSGHIGPFSDPELRECAAKTFAEEFYLDTYAEIESAAKTVEGVELTYRNRDGELQTATVDYLIAATGRVPNVRDLGLENTSLDLDASGVPSFDRTTLRCGASNIFIAGDVTDELMLLHEAADEGKIAGDNAASHPFVSPGARRALLGIIFSDPQIAIVGARFDSLAAGSFVVGEVSFEDQGRSRIMLRNRGLLHVYADTTTGRLLGAEMIGPDAEHIGHLLAWALQMRMTIGEMLEMPFYHPVVEEGLRTALREAQAKIFEAQAGSAQAKFARRPADLRL